MVKRAEKEHAIQFICGRLEDSGNYKIQKKDLSSILVSDLENGSNIELIIPNRSFIGAAKNYTNRVRSNRSNQIYTSPVLYKDGKEAFGRMCDTNKSWRTDRSFKRYTLQQINQMIHLRKIEKEIIGHFGRNLTYFQPKTERLEDSLISYDFEKVFLDRSHLKPGDPGYEYARNEYAKDYLLPTNKEIIGPAAEFRVTNFTGFLAHLVSAELAVNPSEVCRQELMEMARSAYSGMPGMDDQTAYDYFVDND